MQIENIVLLELFVQTVCKASQKEIQYPASSSSTKITTLAQQLDNNKSIMENLALNYENLGELELAAATRKIANALSENELLLSSDKTGRRRLLDYVYPIV